MVAKPAMDLIPERDGQANSRERFEEDVLIFTHSVPKERRSIIRPKLLQQYPKGSPQREIGLEPPNSNVLQLEDRAHQLLKLIRVRLGKDLQQHVSDHCERVLHRSARICTDFVTPHPGMGQTCLVKHSWSATHSEALPFAGSLEPPSSSIIDFPTPMNRATVDDSTAGLGQTLRTGASSGWWAVLP